MTTASNALYDTALERLAEFGPEYGGGLSSHGPMALEALSSLGLPEAYEPYVDRVGQTLEPATKSYEAQDDWEQELRLRLPDLVHKAGAQAGHGLLRVAHATRSLRSFDSDIRRRELAAALDYWSTGTALTSPGTLSGTTPLGDVLERLPRLGPERRPEGLLVKGLGMAMEEPGVLELLTSATPAADLPSAFDQLALAACLAQMHNTGLGGFALLHGVTVSTVACEIVPYLDDEGRRQLESAVVGFVTAAIVAYADDTEHPTMPIIKSGTEDALLARLALKAASGTDDHDIKFAEACTRLFRRTGSILPVQALVLELGDNSQ